MTPSLRDLAEDAFAWLPLIEFDRTRPEFVLRDIPNPNPMYGLVLRPRLVDVDAALAAARAWFRDRGRERYTWLVGDSAEPEDLTDQLLARGLGRDEQEPVFTGMTLDHEPERVAEIEVRRVETFEESLAGARIGWRSFGFTESEVAHAELHHRERYDLVHDWKGGDAFIALVGGEVVGFGTATYLPRAVYLAAGNVAEHMRGRGVYRALVQARWKAAVERGTPALVVQAGKMSTPILARLGFEPVCTISVLVDSTA